MTDSWPNWWPAAGMLSVMLMRWFLSKFKALRAKRAKYREKGGGMEPEDFRFEGGSSLPSIQEAIKDPYPENKERDTSEFFRPAALNPKEEIAAAIEESAKTSLEGDAIQNGEREPAMTFEPLTKNPL